MIKRLYSNDGRFRPVEFNPGLNIVLAERTKESTKNDSCNGLGKSTLIDIIHMLLGSSTKSMKPLLVPELDDWEFTMELSIGDNNLEVSRSINNPNHVVVDGDVLDGYPKGKMSLKSWTSMLGELAFGLEPEDEGTPTFRSLIGYFIRYGRGAYLNPFDSFAKMKSYPRQLNNSFLLGLDTDVANKFELLESRSGVIDQLSREAKAGTLIGIEGKRSDLEALKARLERAVMAQREQLENFNVHPQYEDIEKESSELTNAIHELSNKNFSDRQVLSMYQASIEEEHEAPPVLVEKLYEEAGFVFEEKLKKKLSDVHEFHKTVAKNRRSYLEQEKKRLNREILARETEIERLSKKRADKLSILKTHGALEEYNKLQQRFLDFTSELEETKRKVEVLKRIELGKASIAADKALLKKEAVENLDEHAFQKDKAISSFDYYVKSLYDSEGVLKISIGNNGYSFGTKISRAGSTGIDSMTVFCYDLTLSSIWSEKVNRPGILIHDSIIYDGVDNRQRAIALELARKESENLHFQYICTLNKDELPVDDFSDDFDYEEFVCHRLTDKSIEGSLLGIRIQK